MPSYKVVLNDDAKTELKITADDVSIDGYETEDADGNESYGAGTAFFNFTKDAGGDSNITVAAVPFSKVHYIVG